MIAFSCAHCGMKFSVKDEFAGRQTSCPTCRRPLVVPQAEQTVAFVAPERLDGQLSSLARAGIDPGVTLGTGHSSMEAHEDGRPSLRQLLAGGRNGQRYLLAGEIARGGMGAVLRAVDCDIRREVAVKYLLDQADERKKARFVEEAQITGQLEHPNIVPIHELGVDAKKRLFFSMKMIKGRSLQQVLAELRDSPRGAEKEYPLGRLLTMFVNICHALAYAHSRGVVHRDLKPANIMLGDFGEVYVMDWGVAKVLSDRRDAAVPPALPAVDGTILGTPLYVPPEQARGDLAAIDERSDVYSLGAILYELLTLQPPIDKQGGHPAILARVREGTIVPPQQRDPARTKAGKVPRELSAIALKALAKDKTDRYTSVEALRRDIERFLEGRSVSAIEDTKWEATVKFVKRNKGFSAGMAAALLVLLCSLVFIGKAWLRAERAYAAYQKEQEDKDSRTRQAVPAFVEAARLAVDRRRYDNALTQVNLALDYDADSEETLLLKGQILLARKDFAGARAELTAYLRRHPGDAEARTLVELCGRAKPEAAGNLLAIAQVFERQKSPALADGLLTLHGGTSFEAKKKLLELYRQRIESAWPKRGERLSLDDAGIYRLDLSECKEVAILDALEGMPLTWLNLGGCGQVRDLSPLKGMPLTHLNLSSCGQVRDLSPLKGMPLTGLSLFLCGQVHDLSPLKGMPVTGLSLSNCGQVRDLSPLKGMPLTWLSLFLCGQVRDLSPLAGLNLSELESPPEVDRGMDVLHRMKSLGKIGQMPAAEFWKKYDAGEFKQYKP